MILPHPESDLSLNIMVLGVDIVKKLKHHSNFHLVENLMEEFLKKDKKRTPEMFMNTLTFLYALGLIERKDYKVKLTPRAIQKELF
ncbi:MAG TPA: hypothetical protein VK469_11345 [Candidatus Kapabacteria bacterium]|nr:hypothetical protein [Candidatus Kapabacteria bacterium]